MQALVANGFDSVVKLHAVSTAPQFLPDALPEPQKSLLAASARAFLRGFRGVLDHAAHCFEASMGK